MSFVATDDGLRLYYESTGAGAPILFVHEFAGDCRSWQPQIRHFSRNYRCIAYNARGYPPSDVPADARRYSQQRARDDIKCVLDGLDIVKAHIVGHSMGAFAALHFGFEYPARVRSLVLAGCGYGAVPETRAQFAAEAEAAAKRFEQADIMQAAETYALGPARVQFRNKNPQAWKTFVEQLAEHSPTGLAMTLRGVQARRPSLYDLIAEMKSLDVPTLIITGDEDWPCLEPGLLLKRCIPAAGLAVLPNTGHTIPLEEPDALNALLAQFIAAADAGAWPVRDRAAMRDAILGT